MSFGKCINSQISEKGSGQFPGILDFFLLCVTILIIVIPPDIIKKCRRMVVSLMEEIMRFGVSMEKNLLTSFDELISRKGYTNRSEAFRDLVREHLVEEEWRTEKKEMIGTITIVYNHHTRGLSDTLTDLQHQFLNLAISTTHVHLDEVNCLEVLIVKGRADKIKFIADKLISTRGVKHGKLTMTTTGKELS